MEALAPAELVEVGDQVIKVIDKRTVSLSSVFHAAVVDLGVFVDDRLHLVGGEICERTGIGWFDRAITHADIPERFSVSD